MPKTSSKALVRALILLLALYVAAINVNVRAAEEPGMCASDSSAIPGGEDIGEWAHDGGLPTSGSPFGLHPARVNTRGYADNGFADAQFIGVRWHRPGLYAFWFLIQPDIDEPVFNFALNDLEYSAVPPGINIVANICPENPRSPEGVAVPGTYLPIDEHAYQVFVRTTVERYDGDGIDDMPGLSNAIRTWQVGNEPKPEFPGFARLHQLTAVAIKQACPDCSVLIGGVSGFPEGYVEGFDTVFDPILAELEGDWIDVFDFHWYGSADGDYRFLDPLSGEDALDHIRTALIRHGFDEDIPIWITEMGSYSGDPAGPRFPYQSERQQGADYFKRFIYSLARGVEKVMPAFGLIEGFKGDNGYFDHTGLMYDGLDPGDRGLGVKKLSYFTYWKATQMLEGCEWPTLSTLRDGTGEDWLYLFSVQKDHQTMYIAWWDHFDDHPLLNHKELLLDDLGGDSLRVTAVIPNAVTGQDVTTLAEAFSVQSLPIVDRTATVVLGEDPVIIEILPTAPPRLPSGRQGHQP